MKKQSKNPKAVAASPENVPAMIGGGIRNGIAGTADHLPMAHCPGALSALITDLVDALGGEA